MVLKVNVKRKLNGHFSESGRWRHDQSSSSKMNVQMQIWTLHRAKTGQFLEYNLESLKDVNEALEIQRQSSTPIYGRPLSSLWPS